MPPAPSSETHDGERSSPQYLLPLSTTGSEPPLIQELLPRRTRSALHAAETLADKGFAWGAIGWLVATEVEPPIEWFVNVATVYPRSDKEEFYGHAILRAVKHDRRDVLEQIAVQAAGSEPRIAQIAARALAGIGNAIREAESVMQTTRVDIARVDLPTRAELNAPPPALPPPAPLAEVDDLAVGLIRANGEEARFRMRAEIARVYPMIYVGASHLRWEKPSWAWRYFEAAEHLRDLGLARDA